MSSYLTSEGIPDSWLLDSNVTESMLTSELDSLGWENLVNKISTKIDDHRTDAKKHEILKEFIFLLYT